MIVSVEELGQTSLYPEIIDEISRGNYNAVVLQILAAEEIAKSYLFKYDLLAIFGTEDIAPTCSSELIKTIVKSIATYRLLMMANPNVNLELFQMDYKESIRLLENIRDGKNNPILPYAVDDPSTTQDESNSDIKWDSNPKRNNHG